MSELDPTTSGEGQGGPSTMAPAQTTLWDHWDTPPRIPSIPVLHLEGFDGPMDLLLDLAERQRIDFGRMSIRALAEQFVAALERLASSVPLEKRADWVVVATRLVLLRSRLVFPQTPEAAVEAEREARRTLRDLDELAAARRLAAWLRERPQLGVDVFGRGSPEKRALESGYVALMEACLAVLRREAPEERSAPTTYQPLVHQLWRLSDAIAHLRQLLADRPEGDELVNCLLQVFEPTEQGALCTRKTVAVTLMAALELAKNGMASLEQGSAFGPIWLASRAKRSIGIAA